MLRRSLPEGSRESSLGRVARVIEDPPGFPYTPPGVDILEGGKLTSNNVAGSSHDPLQSFAVASGAVSKPGGDTAGQDALLINHNNIRCINRHVRKHFRIIIEILKHRGFYTRMFVDSY